MYKRQNWENVYAKVIIKLNTHDLGGITNLDQTIASEINNEQIQREFKFSDFIEAFSFMTKIALICEKYNHHPNWENVYSKVIIRLSTHDLGGITNLDQTLASEINKVFDQ